MTLRLRYLTWKLRAVLGLTAAARGAAFSAGGISGIQTSP